MKNIILVIAIIILASCSKSESSEPDTNNKDLFKLECEALNGPDEVLMTLSESKKFIPYPDSIKSIILSDSLGKELRGEVISYSTEIVQSQGHKSCPLNKYIRPYYSWWRERTRLSIYFDSLELTIDIDVSPVWNFGSEDPYPVKVADFCRGNIWPLQSGNSNSNIGYFFAVVHPRDEPKLSEILTQLNPTFFLHGVKFTNVYTSYADDHPNMQYDMYYNSTQGLVGFKNSQNPSSSYKFERFE